MPFSWLWILIRKLVHEEIKLYKALKYKSMGSKSYKNISDNLMSVLQRPFVYSGRAESCHSRSTFLPETIFYKHSIENLMLPFPVVWPRLSCRASGTAKPKCRCSTWQTLHGVSWPDKGRERKRAIYLYSLWFCVLRTRLPDPEWIFCLRTKTDGWLSIHILRGTVEINVRSICVNRVWAFDVWSNPMRQYPPRFFILVHL